MEESPEEANGRRELDFNLPLLSTRRQCNDVVFEERSTNSINLPQRSSRDIHRVPFCWERAPGKPKRPPAEVGAEDVTPRLRLPPCRWNPKADEANDAVLSRDVDDACKPCPVSSCHEDDDGCDADVDDDLDDYYSNAYMDALSLTEAIDIAQRGDIKGCGGTSFGRKLDGERNTYNDAGGEYPNFMMERFLPDATALAAASSVIYAANKMMPPSGSPPPPNGYQSPTEASVIAQKGCGFDALFPWRGMNKHKLCNAKNAERQVVLASVVGQPARRRSDAKDMKRRSKGDKGK
ncbi:hypothetical protein LINGRAHAP2_LOCUS13211 [Linum grandiflorum]